MSNTPPSKIGSRKAARLHGRQPTSSRARRAHHVTNCTLLVTNRRIDLTASGHASSVSGKGYGRDRVPSRAGDKT